MTHTAFQAALTNDSTDVLVRALKLKYMVSAFYEQGLAMTYPVPFRAEERDALAQIAKHEAAHVTQLRSALGSAAPAQPAASSYDFTGGSGSGCGPFRGAFGAPATTSPSNSAVAATSADRREFLKLATIFEDLCMRAYKGSLVALIGSGHLSTMFRMHSTDARHSAGIRLLRNSYAPGSEYVPPMELPSTNVQAWITKSAGNGFADRAYTTSVVYPGGLSQVNIVNGIATNTTVDGKTVQTVTMVGVYGPVAPSSPTPKALSTEDNEIQSSSQAKDVYLSGSQIAFDEPLGAAAVTSLVALFGVV